MNLNNFVNQGAAKINIKCSYSILKYKIRELGVGITVCHLCVYQTMQVILQLLHSGGLQAC